MAPWQTISVPKGENNANVAPATIQQVSAVRILTDDRPKVGRSSLATSLQEPGGPQVPSSGLELPLILLSRGLAYRSGDAFIDHQSDLDSTVLSPSCLGRVLCHRL